MTRGIKDYFGVTDKSNVCKGTLLGLFGGIILGGVTALVLAPKSGEETRADIKAGFEVGVEKAREFGEKLSATAHEKIEVVKEKLSKETAEVAEEVAKKAEKVAEKAEKTAEKAKKDS